MTVFFPDDFTFTIKVRQDTAADVVFVHSVDQ